MFRGIIVIMIRQSIVALNSTPIDLTRSGVLDRPMALSIQNIMTTGYAYLGMRM